MSRQYETKELYIGVIEDLIHRIKEPFLEDGIDISLLNGLKESWEKKINELGFVNMQGNSEPKQLLSEKLSNKNISSATEPIHPNLKDMRLPRLRSGKTYNVLPRYMVKSEVKSAESHKSVKSEVPQLDGGGTGLMVKSEVPKLNDGGPGMSDSSSEEEQEEGTGLEEKSNQEAEYEEDKDEKPLNSEDDLSDEDEAGTIFDDGDNIVICQFEKIYKQRNMWKFHLNDGIMRIHNKEYCFHTLRGDAEW